MLQQPIRKVSFHPVMSSLTEPQFREQTKHLTAEEVEHYLIELGIKKPKTAIPEGSKNTPESGK
jgi:hypothetical protein